jgi:hypothetical protein
MARLHCRDSRLDLLNRHFRHLRITASFGEEHEGDALIASGCGSMERHALADQFLQGFATGGNRLVARADSDECLVLRFVDVLPDECLHIRRTIYAGQVRIKDKRRNPRSCLDLGFKDV